MLLRDSVNKTSLLGGQGDGGGGGVGRELARDRSKIDIFVPLRTCCFATKLLLMRPRPAPVKGLRGAEGASGPTAPFAKCTE